MKAQQWQFDPTHSELRFRIRHLMISHVSGSFKQFTVTMETLGDDITTANVAVEAEMASVSTGNDQRDAHLRNGDFFDAPTHPKLRFQSTRIEKTDEETYTLTGDLTMKGETRPVKLAMEYSGLTRDPWGNQRAGFIVTGKINRSDWGINFNNVLETGGVALSDEVRISAEVQMIREAVTESQPA